jgi:hypothetical protein
VSEIALDAQTEVQDLHTPCVRNEDVVGLDVAVNHSPVVGCCQYVEDIDANLADLVGG